MKRAIFLIMFLLLGIDTRIAMAQTAAAVAPVSLTIDDYSAQMRSLARNQERDDGGFVWQDWAKAGTVAKFVRDREPSFDTMIDNKKHLDFVLYDADGNGRPDVLVYLWGDCASRGCPYNIYFDTGDKKPVYYFGWKMLPYAKGVMLDDGYFHY